MPAAKAVRRAVETAALPSFGDNVSNRRKSLAASPSLAKEPQAIEREPVKTYSLKELRGHPRAVDSNSLIGEGILKENSIMVIAGQMKSYKSFATDAMAIQLALGKGHLFNAYRTEHARQYMAFPVERECRVLILEQEVGEDDLETRIMPMVDALPPEDRLRVEENVFTHSMDYDLQLDTQKGYELIRTLVGDFKPNVLVFDPLCEFHTANENDTQSMAKVMRAIDYIRAEFKPLATVLNHHEGHQQKGFEREGLDRLRGSSVIGGKCDTGMLLKVKNRNAMWVEVEFVLRRGRPIHPFLIKYDKATMVPNFLSWDTKIKEKAKKEVDLNSMPVETAREQ